MEETCCVLGGHLKYTWIFKTHVAMTNSRIIAFHYRINPHIIKHATETHSRFYCIYTCNYISFIVFWLLG